MLSTREYIEIRKGLKRELIYSSKERRKEIEEAIRAIDLKIEEKGFSIVK